MKYWPSVLVLGALASRPALALELASSEVATMDRETSEDKSSRGVSKNFGDSRNSRNSEVSQSSEASLSSSSLDVSSDSFKPLAQSVVELLNDLTKQLKADQGKDEKTYKVYQKFVAKETRRLEGEIEDSKETIEAASSSLQEQAAQASSKQAKLEKIADEVSRAEKDLADASDIRTSQQNTFKKNEGELLVGIDEFKRSLQVMKKKMPKGSFLETTSGDEDDEADENDESEAVAPTDGPGLLQAAKRLRSTLSAARDLNLSPDDRDTLLHFVRSAAEFAKGTSATSEVGLGADAGGVSELSFLQVGAGAKEGGAPEHMKSVMKTLKGVLKKTQAQLQTLRKQERQSVADYKPLKVSLEDGIASKKKIMNTLKLEIPQHAQKSSEFNATLLSEKEKLKSAQEALAQLEEEAKSAKAQHELQTKKRSDELLAVKEAKQILTSDESRKLLWTEEDSFVEAPASFVQVAKSSSKLLLKHSEPSAGPFENVKKMISRMLQKLEADQMADIKLSDWCQAEKKRSTASKRLRVRDVERASDRMAEINAAMIENSEKLTKTKKEMKELERSLAEAAKFRKSESKSNKKAVTKYTKAVKLLKDAVAALRKFYDQHANKGQKKDYQPSASGTQAINILEMAWANFGELLRTQESTEKTSQENFKKYMDESNIRKAVLNKDLEHKNRQATKLKSERLSIGEDLKSYQKELEAVVSYEAQLDGSCSAKESDYDSRADQRKKELEALNEALGYLAPKNTET